MTQDFENIFKILSFVWTNCEMSLVNNQGRPYIRGKQLLPELSEHIRYSANTITVSVQQKLLETRQLLHECPSESAILWSTRNKLGMTWKKISQLLWEATAPANIDKTDEYLENVTIIKPRNLKFFDESSVVFTTGNWSYGCTYQICPYPPWSWKQKFDSARIGTKILEGSQFCFEDLNQ